MNARPSLRIGIDARLYNQTGVGRYIKNIIPQLSHIDSKNKYFIYLKDEEYDVFVPPANNFIKRRANISWHSLSEQYNMPRILLKDQLDLVHFPYFNIPVFYPKKYIITIHDLIIDHFNTGRASTLPYPYYLLKRLGYKLSITRGIRHAEAITVISQTTKQEVVDHYQINPQKVFITYDALDQNFKSVADRQTDKKYYDKPYILYVGNAYPHKNLIRLLAVFNIIKKRIPVNLVLAGDDNYFYPRLRNEVNSMGLSERVIFFGKANDEDLANLYTNAKCMVFPSLMEGFGLPNLEALYCHVLPVISDIPVFREIWKDNLPMFTPTDIRGMAEVIISVLNMSKNEYAQKVSKARKFISLYSWQDCARKTYQIYQEIIGKS